MKPLLASGFLILGAASLAGCNPDRDRDPVMDEDTTTAPATLAPAPGDMPPPPNDAAIPPPPDETTPPDPLQDPPLPEPGQEPPPPSN